MATLTRYRVFPDIGRFEDGIVRRDYALWACGGERMPHGRYEEYIIPADEVERMVHDAVERVYGKWHGRGRQAAANYLATLPEDLLDLVVPAIRDRYPSSLAEPVIESLPRPRCERYATAR